ncbi:hypothetical protein AA0120_g12652 [Alternaria tenuissima]|nr:hypothetical protein AA0120_g12652 [Alternaria tenuissima]
MVVFGVSFALLVIAILRANPVATTGLSVNSQSSTRTVFQFDNGTWVENIAARPNGKLLITILNRPELYQIDPFKNTASLVTNLEDEAHALSLVGITEMSPDVFVFIAGNYSLARLESDPKSYSIWQIDFNRGGRRDQISRIAKLPEARFLNGMTTLNRKDGIVLISDSDRGVVWRLNIQTGKYDVVLEDPTMKPVEGMPLILGINGIKIFKSYLYYVNTMKRLFCRVRIDTSTGKASGPYEIIATDLPGDDFIISADGSVFITENSVNSLERIGMNGSRSLIAGGLNSTVIAGVTSIAFGRSWRDPGIAYAATSGALIAPVNGTYSEGGKVVAVVL